MRPSWDKATSVAPAKRSSALKPVAPWRTRKRRVVIESQTEDRGRWTDEELQLPSSVYRPPSGFFDRMSPKLIPHGGQEFAGIVAVVPTVETVKERLRDDRRGHIQVNRFLNRPAPFPRVLNKALEVREFSIFFQGFR